ncbi:hypothetical protein Slin15195_G044940 [Septoria linicola]|uniref:Uncharacterized protein n=1 Tax=Septoria linicola TaxID=215465 RepID=A0A9Q9ARF6_9PEZI|nr:hypothetical protein Slin14017_G048460 [Septoria linicola]USW51175.1 hypothetical protein Slin15195_G044940 [Septoria linicola]
MATTNLDMEIDGASKISEETKAEQLQQVAVNGGATDEGCEKIATLNAEITPTTAHSSDMQTEQVEELLLDKALMSLKTQPISKFRRRFLKEGDVMVVLDRSDLSITCRLRSEDLRRSTGASFLLAPAVKRSDAEGVNYLCVLEVVDGEGMPRLAGRSLSTKLSGYGPLYAQNSIDAARLKSENAAVETQKMDWIRAYESFFHVLSHVEPKHQLINRKDVHAAVPHIEAISRIIAAEAANTARSALTTAFKVLFAEYSDLWAAVATEPTRWLAIGQNLRHEPVFKEAMVHLAAQYPTVDSRGILDGTNLAVVQRLATQKHYHRLSIDQELLILTIDAKRSALAYSLLHYVLDWIRDHLREHGVHHGKNIEPNALCSHDTGDCTQPAGFYRLLDKGGDSYLPEGQVFDALGRFMGSKLSSEQRDSTRNNLKILKAKISSIVEPLLKSPLQYEKRAELTYLTNIYIEAGDLPWLRGAATAGTDDIKGAESDSDEDMED